MAHGDKRDARSNACAKNSQRPVILLFKPAQRAFHIQHRLAVSLEGQADVWPDQVIRPRMAWNRSAVMIRETHLDRGKSKAIEPAAHILLLFPSCVPLRQHDDSRLALARE